MAGIVQGITAAAPELAGLALFVALVWLLTLAGQRRDRQAQRRRRRAIAAARVLADAPAWVTPQMVYVRGGRIIGVRCWGRLDDPSSQLAQLESMMVRSRRAGAR